MLKEYNATNNKIPFKSDYLEIECSTPIEGTYNKNFQSIGLLKQKLRLRVSRITLTYDIEQTDLPDDRFAR